MVSKKTASEINPIKVFLMWFECTDKITPKIQSCQNFIKLLNEVSIKLPKEKLEDIFPAEMDDYSSDEIVELLNKLRNSENGFVNVPLKICIQSLVSLWLLTKAKFRSKKKLKNYVITNSYNICWYNLSNNTNEEVTLLDVVMFSRIALKEDIFLYMDNENNISLMDALSIVRRWIKQWRLEWSVLNTFGLVDMLIEDFGWEWRKVISAIKNQKEEVRKNWDFSNELFEQIDKAMSKVSKWTIVIEYKDYMAEYLTHNFKSEDLSKYRELQDYAINEWSWCWTIWKEAFKWRTVAITWSKKIKLKEDKKRKK